MFAAHCPLQLEPTARSVSADSKPASAGEAALPFDALPASNCAFRSLSSLDLGLGWTTVTLRQTRGNQP